MAIVGSSEEERAPDGQEVFGPGSARYSTRSPQIHVCGNVANGPLLLTAGGRACARLQRRSATAHHGLCAMVRPVATRCGRRNADRRRRDRETGNAPVCNSEAEK